MRCECGCEEQSHRVVPMSVPLVNPKPLYPMPPWSPIVFAGGPKATLDHAECQCGCCDYEPDTP